MEKKVNKFIDEPYNNYFHFTDKSKLSIGLSSDNSKEIKYIAFSDEESVKGYFLAKDGSFHSPDVYDFTLDNMATYVTSAADHATKNELPIAPQLKGVLDSLESLVE